MRRDMETVRAIGGKRIAAPPVGMTDRTGVDLRVLGERYRALCELGDQMGVVPEAEVWGFSKTMGRLGEVAAILIESGHPKACLLPDVYHLYKGGSNYDGIRVLAPSAVHVFHMNDVPADPPRRHDQGRAPSLPGNRRRAANQAAPRPPRRRLQGHAVARAVQPRLLEARRRRGRRDRPGEDEGGRRRGLGLIGRIPTPMRIDRIDLSLVRLPLIRTFRTSSSTQGPHRPHPRPRRGGAASRAGASAPARPTPTTAPRRPRPAGTSSRTSWRRRSLGRDWATIDELVGVYSARSRGTTSPRPGSRWPAGTLLGQSRGRCRCSTCSAATRSRDPLGRQPRDRGRRADAPSTRSSGTSARATGGSSSRSRPGWDVDVVRRGPRAISRRSRSRSTPTRPTRSTTSTTSSGSTSSTCS